MRRYQHAVLLRYNKRKDTTEHDLQHGYDKYHRAELLQANGASERQIETMLKESDEMHEIYPKANVLKCDGPECPHVPRPKITHEEQVALAQAALAEAEAALAAKNERDALAAKIDAEIALADATSTLLADIRILRLTGNQTYRRPEFAAYRKELSDIASSYGVKIVLVGDKSSAELVLN